MNYDYDIIIIGGGPGGYVAAERAGKQGAKVLLVEKDRLGGVCLNKGCIPTKTLIHSAKLYQQMKDAEKIGIACDKMSYDLQKVMTRKNKVVDTLVNGVTYLMKQAGVDVIKGEALLSDNKSVLVNQKKITGKNIILATGSSSVRPPVEGIDTAGVLTSDEILEIKTLPESITIIGGGVIGIEFAGYFSMLGVNVSVIEILPEILYQFDPDIARLVRQSMPGCTFYLNTTVEKMASGSIFINQDGKKAVVESNLVLLATGRIPNVRGLGLENINLEVTDKGIVVNEKMETNIPGVYAIGDVTGKSMLAHAASRMGEVAVNTILGREDYMRYHAIPWVVYGHPEVASAGVSEKEARARNLPVRKVTVPMRTNGRFLAEHGEQRGLCKMIVHKDSRILIGMSMVGDTCSEIIYGAAAMIEDEFRLEDIQQVVFPHPTVSEIIKDAAWMLGMEK